MMDTREFSLTHRGLEAQTGYFVLAMILSLLFVLVTWRWAGLVNPRIWTVWEDQGTSVSARLAHLPALRKTPRIVARTTQLSALRQQESRALLLRMFALGLGHSRTE